VTPARQHRPPAATRRTIVPAAAVIAAAVTAAALLAGCGRSAAAGSSSSPPPPGPIATATSTSGASWAIVRSGGAAVGGKFWQLLVRPAGSTTWRLATPPGVADNGGLVVTGAANGTMTAGFVPNELLKFTPLASSTDTGTHWTQGLLSAGLSAAPSALAAVPGGRLVAITSKGAAEESGHDGSGWTSLTTLRSLAATPAGRSCGLTALSAVAVGRAGTPLVAGACSRSGKVGIFVRSAGGWGFAAESQRGTGLNEPVRVLQMVSLASGTDVLLAVGSGPGEIVRPAWLSASTGVLTTGYPLNAKGSPITSTFFASSGAWGVVFGERARFDGIGSSGYLWFNNDATLPAQHATVVAQPGLVHSSGGLTALVPGLDTVAVWQQDKAGTWHRTQLISLPSAPS
jgi:hypothetical protein